MGRIPLIVSKLECLDHLVAKQHAKTNVPASEPQSVPVFSYRRATPQIAVDLLVVAFLATGRCLSVAKVGLLLSSSLLLHATQKSKTPSKVAVIFPQIEKVSSVFLKLTVEKPRGKSGNGIETEGGN